MSELSYEFNAALQRIMGDEEYARFTSPRGLARHALWQCADGWCVGYTTERIEGGGENHGKFAALEYRPVGKGSQSGKPEEWKMVYFRTFAKRKTARARAEKMYEQHMEKARAAK